MTANTTNAGTHHLGRWPWVVVVALVVVVIGAIVFASVHRVDATKSIPPVARHADAPRKATPFRLSALSPLPRATGVAYDAPIVLTFSDPLSPRTPLPSLIPAINGVWSVHHSELRFRPSGFYIPSSREQILIPAGIRALDGTRLTVPIRSAFRVEAGSILRLQQLLAELDYLPVGFAPKGPGPASIRATSALTTEPVDPTVISLFPRPGQFTWRFARIPSQLAETWQSGSWNVATEGAVIAFETDHHLAPDGEPGTEVWTQLLGAVAARTPSIRPYDYLVVTETLPETLYVWRDGAVVFQTPVNTGVYGAATPLGTWPVYLRYTSTTMTGKNPNGTKYSDPGVPWVSYFHGSDAVHGFWRSNFGYPQSDGCVEVPVTNAAAIFPDDPYGTLVTVTTGNLGPELGTSAPAVAATRVVASTTTTVAPSTTTTSSTPSSPPSTTSSPIPATTTASASTTATT